MKHMLAFSEEDIVAFFGGVMAMEKMSRGVGLRKVL